MAQVVGKPERSFYRLALDDLGLVSLRRLCCSLES